jgi:hypothetical protein
MRKIMNRVTVTACGLYMAAAGLAPFQSKPDFSGTWSVALVPGVTTGWGSSADMGGGAAKPICGAEFSLTQDAASLRINRPLGERTVSVVLKLDGSTVRHAAPLCRVLSPAMEKEAAGLYEAAARQGISLEMATTATWAGDSLVLLSTLSAGIEKIERKQVLTLTDGTTLVVETTGTMNGVKGLPDRTAYRRKK